VERGLAAAHIIDLNDPEPAFREIAPMANPRWFPNSALLPDGTLFVCGGGREHNADPVLEPEIFDPASGAFTAAGNSMAVPRSRALLRALPDGKIQIIGGGSQNCYLNQATANATGLPVFAGPVEATVIGNVSVQAIAEGRFASLTEARQYVAQNLKAQQFMPQASIAGAEAKHRYDMIEARLD